jgi:tRNA pseudouridine32 synthase / 23S rRNA pseudouridine746 synthase
VHTPLPTKNGVGPSILVLPPSAQYHTLLDYLDERFATIPRDEIAARMLRGDVLNEQGMALPLDHPYRVGEKLFYYRHIENEPRVPFQETILFEDDLIIVVDKPHFLSVTPGGRFVQETVLVRLKNKLGLDTIAPMHRLDRETAGLVLFTKKPETRGAYQAMFSAQTAEKTYHAIARYQPEMQFPSVYESTIAPAEHFMRMRELAAHESAGRTPNAETEITLLDHDHTHARYALAPRTGKKHQLRVHMMALGMPILNDQIYPVHVSADEEDVTTPLQLLAKSIRFIDPITQTMREFTSPRELILPSNSTA